MIRRSSCLGIALILSALLANARAQPDEDPALGRTAYIQNGADLNIGDLIPDLALTDINDQPRSLASLLHQKKALVIFMTGVGCPLSNRYAPRAAQIESEFADKGIAFLYINPIEVETIEEIRAHIRDNAFKAPYIADRDQITLQSLRPRTTTKVFLIDSSRTLRYRGAIDDQFGIGLARDTPAHTYLRDAIEALLAEREPRITATWPPGCLLDPPDAPSAAPSELTYYGRIARIIDRHCLDCHRRDGVGPFSLDNIQHVRARASMMEAVVRDGLMPPSHGIAPRASTTSPWVRDYTLPDRDRDDLIAWLRSDRPLGTPTEAPKPRTILPTWQIGTPDALLWATMRLPADGPMQYARIIIPTNFTSDTWISAIEFRPVKRDTVHHAHAWIIPPGTPLPAPNTTPTSLPFLAAYSPSDHLILYPENTARLIPAGSSILVDLYARPMGRAENSRLRIALRFPKHPPTHEIQSFTLAADQLSIPPHAPSITTTLNLTLPEETRLLAFTPIMRSRGQSISLNATPPDSPRFALLDAPRYDFRWQIRYEFAEPMTLPRGTALAAIATHNNSPENPNNSQPEAPAGLGPTPTDEACLIAFEVVIPR